MVILTNCFIGFVGIQHILFLFLEMFLWRSPIGLKIFGMSAEKAEVCAVLAANQGLYNGFLAAGLFFSFFIPPESAQLFRVFFLSCVLVAGLYGAWSVSPRILFIQAIPALLALGLVLFGTPITV